VGDLEVGCMGIAVKFLDYRPILGGEGPKSGGSAPMIGGSFQDYGPFKCLVLNFKGGSLLLWNQRTGL